MTELLTTAEVAEKLDAIDLRIIASTGALTPRDVATLCGRRSRSRAVACALGLGRHLPAPPPIEEDASLLSDARGADRLARRLAARLKRIVRDEDRAKR